MRLSLATYLANVNNNPIKPTYNKNESGKIYLPEFKIFSIEICYKTGYEDQSYFRNVFKKYTGLTPVDYKKQFTFRV
jgi:YesN/AraC family two-component response regulator